MTPDTPTLQHAVEAAARHLSSPVGRRLTTRPVPFRGPPASAHAATIHGEPACERLLRWCCLPTARRSALVAALLRISTATPR